MPFGLPSKRRTKNQLIIEVPRLPDRSTLRRCRARAKVIAAREEGIRTEPLVEPYDNRPIEVGGPMTDPQGWTFTFDLDDETPEETNDG